MANINKVLSTLEHELEFLDQGGYRRPVSHRQPLFCMETSTEFRPALFFEESPSCPKERYCECSVDRDCVLMTFVPLEHRNQKVPCRHIPLNEKGETIASLSDNHASRLEIEAALRRWLQDRVRELRGQLQATTEQETGGSATRKEG